MNYRLAAKAQRDLTALYEPLLSLLRSTFDMLSRYPEAGHARPELGKSLRSYPVGPVVIYYRPVAGGVGIMRVIVGKRDLRAIFPRK